MSSENLLNSSSIFVDVHSSGLRTFSGSFQFRRSQSMMTGL